MFESLFNKVTLLKETPTQVFSCEYSEIFKNSFFHRALPRWLLLLVTLQVKKFLFILFSGYSRTAIVFFKDAALRLWSISQENLHIIAGFFKVATL